MTISLIPAVIAILLGLLASGAIDFVQSDGGTHPDAWTVFALALILVARDTLLGGSFRPHRSSGDNNNDGNDGNNDRNEAAANWRSPLRNIEVRGGDVRIRIWSFEPVATTLAIITGLLAVQAIDFTNADGGTTDWGWTAFALALFLTIGGRLSRRPRHRRGKRRRRWRDAERVAGEFEAHVEEVIDEVERAFSQRPRRDE